MPTEAPPCSAPTIIKAQIHTCFSSIALVYSSPSSSRHLSPPPCSRAANVAAHLPLAAVRPSGLVSVMPSMGDSPSLATAR